MSENHHLLPRLIGRHIPNRSEVYSKNISKQKFEYDKIVCGKKRRRDVQLEIDLKRLEEDMKRINARLVEHFESTVPAKPIDPDRIIIYAGNSENTRSSLTQLIDKTYDQNSVIILTWNLTWDQWF